jgi:anti-anti-sigma factor
MSNNPIGEHLMLCPLEPLVAGGGAEAFERHLCQLYRSGYRRLTVDLSNVPAIDAAGIRALARAHEVARRLNGTLRLAGAGADVLRVMETTDLVNVFDRHASPDAMPDAALSSRAIRIIAGTMLTTALGTAIVWAGSSVWRRRRRL